MNGIIIYGTFHGSTKSCAEVLAQYTGFSAVDAKTALNLDFSSYDQIIIGTALQKFHVHPDIEALFKRKKEFFTQERTSVFHVGANGQLPAYFQKQLKKIRTVYFGCKIDWDTLSRPEQIILSVISFFSRKKLKGMDTIQIKRIERFATEITGKK